MKRDILFDISILIVIVFAGFGAMQVATIVHELTHFFYLNSYAVDGTQYICYLGFSPENFLGVSLPQAHYKSDILAQDLEQYNQINSETPAFYLMFLTFIVFFVFLFIFLSKVANKLRLKNAQVN